MGFATRNNALMNIFAARISKAINVANGDYICESNLVRICAKEETTIISSNCKVGEGLLLPQGAIEYFQTEEGEVLTITGSVNISSIM